MAAEVFEGNTGDPKKRGRADPQTASAPPAEAVVVVGEGGMLTSARIGEDLETEEGVRWITAWKVPQIQQWAADGNLQVARLEQQDLAEIRHPRIRENVGLPAAIPYWPKSGSASEKSCSAPRRNNWKRFEPLRHAAPAARGQKEIGVVVGQVLGHYQMGKPYS